MIDRLVLLVSQEASEPLIVVGPSGAGKSSVLRAGLLPRLDPARPTVVFEPSSAPLADLKAHVTGLAWSAGPTVIVDQFEGVFTQCTDESARRDFIAAVCDLAGRALVILAIRADFYPYAIRYPELASALQHRQVVIGAMTADQVRQAVVEPARLARTGVEPGLVSLLLTDLAPRDEVSPGSGVGEQLGAVEAYEAGALPMLSHVMLATWTRSRGGVLTVADYMESGGIRNALTQTAELAYDALSPDEQRSARRLFLRLVHVADDLPPSRANVSLTELRVTAGPDAVEVLATFVSERLITVDADTAQITHDALLTGWARLRGWIETDKEGLRTRRRITEAARIWQDTGQEDAALLRGSTLAVANDWMTSEDNRRSLSALAVTFVRASVAEESAQERAERRRLHRLQSTTAVLAVLVVLIGLLAGYAFHQRQVATTARNNANSRELAIEAGQVRNLNEPLAAQLSVEAYDIAHTPQAAASLLESSGSPSAARILDSSGVVQWAALAPDHQLLAVAGADGSLRLWNVAMPGDPLLVYNALRPDSLHPLYTAAFSPDGRVLAAAGAGRVVKLWNVSDPRQPVRLPELTGPTNTIYSVAFNPGGHILAAASADDTVRLWDVADPRHAHPLGRPLTGLTGFVETLAFSPDGGILAAASGNTTPGSADDSIWLWNVLDPGRPMSFRNMPLRGPANVVSGITFSPNSHLLAASSRDHRIWLWRISAAGHRNDAGALSDGALTGATNWANTVAFSPDGTSLAAGTSDASAIVWNIARRSVIAILPQSQPVTSVTWDGASRLITSDADGTVSLWQLPVPVLITGNAATAVVYSPDGKSLTVGGNTVQTWSVATHALIGTWPLPTGTVVNGLAYAPQGAEFAVAMSNGTVQLFDARSTRPINAPFRVTSTGAAETVAFSPNGRTLATGADDGTVRLWSLNDRAAPRRLSTVRDSGTYVYTVVFAPDGKTLAAASVDNLTRLWDVAKPANPSMLGSPLGGMASYAIGLAFSPSGQLLAIGSADKTIRIWDVTDPDHPIRVNASLGGAAGYVWAVAFSPNGKMLAAGVTDGTVWLWNVADPARASLMATLTGPNGHVFSVAFNPSGTALAASSDDGTVHIWDTNPEVARASICRNAGQALSEQEWGTYVPGLVYRDLCS